jgi:DNA-binding beta-propeller fold protein YncE
MSRASPIHLPVLGDEIVAIDESTLAVSARMPGGIYPDGLAYAPTVHKLYVSDELGRTETVIDVRTRQRIATIALAGEAGNSQYDPVTQHIFVTCRPAASSSRSILRLIGSPPACS